MYLSHYNLKKQEWMKLSQKTNAKRTKPSSYHLYACQYDRQPESWDHYTRGEEVWEFPARIAGWISVIS